MCNECMNECIGVTPCKECDLLDDEKINEEINKFSYGDVLAVISIVAVAYLWAIVG